MSTTASVFLGTGRRKTSVARVRLNEGTGKVVVNGLPVDQYFKTESFVKSSLAPLVATTLSDKVDISANVDGGGVSGQAGAVSHGIARALQRMNPELRAVLKKAGLLTRDSREKERKKAGQPGARKRFQFSKR